jgi:hypothetical protein
MKTKIKIRDYAATKRINAPLTRKLWYLVTFGKWGEIAHYEHVSMREFIATTDDRVRYAHNITTGVLFSHDYNLKIVNCRCTMNKIQKITT